MRIGKLEIKLFISWGNPHSRPKKLSWSQKRQVISCIRGKIPVPGDHSEIFVRGFPPGKIPVIKYVRSLIDCTLEEGKDIVDQLYDAVQWKRLHK